MHKNNIPLSDQTSLFHKTASYPDLIVSLFIRVSTVLLNMSTYRQPQTRSALTPPATVKYQIVWQETPAGHPEPGEGEIILTVTNITIIADGSGAHNPQYTTVA